MRNTQDTHDPLECDNSASDDCGACSCQRLHLRNVKHTHSASAFNCSALSTLSLCLCLCLCFILSMAAPQTSCILCNKEDLRAREPTISGSYEEFTFDHQVSREEAIQALRKYNESKAHSQALLKALSLSYSHSLCSTRQAQQLWIGGVYSHIGEILFGAEVCERSLLVWKSASGRWVTNADVMMMKWTGQQHRL